MFKLKTLLIAYLFFIINSVSAQDEEWPEDIYEFIEEQHIPLDENENLINVFSATGEEDELVVDFMLYTRNNVRNPIKIIPDEENSLANIDVSKDLKVVIHGWRNRLNSSINDNIKEAYLNALDVNVLVLDWSSRSYLNYIASKMSVVDVGKELANLLDDLVRRGQDIKRIHLIGHSLGAHIAGITGKRMKTGQVSRITGLDPASPLFSAAGDDTLKPSCADFVDVIHTCGYMLGFISPLGHVDFYPNKGTPPQPGCGFDYTGKCSHSMAYKLFADSVKGDNKMLAISCEDSTAYSERRCSSAAPVPMGEYTPPNTRGMYFLDTGKEAPFGKGVPRR